MHPFPFIIFQGRASPAPLHGAAFQRAPHYPILFFYYITHRQRGSDVGSRKTTSALLMKYWLYYLRSSCQACVTGDRGSAEPVGFLAGAVRSRCHEAVFNRISPSLLDRFHDSGAASHFQFDMTPHIYALPAVTPCILMYEKAFCYLCEMLLKSTLRNILL